MIALMNLPYFLDDQLQFQTEVKQLLFARTQEINSLEKELEKIVLLPKKKRVAWLTEDEQFISSMFADFMDDSMVALDGLQLDPQTAQLSTEYVTKLRDVMNVMNAIVKRRQQLIA